MNADINSIIHMNCRNLVAHYENMIDYLRNLVMKFDVIALSETWISPDKHDIKEYYTEHYTLYTSTRNVDKTGDGVAIYVHDRYFHT